MLAATTPEPITPETEASRVAAEMIANPPGEDVIIRKAAILEGTALKPERARMTPAEHSAQALEELRFFMTLRAKLLAALGRDLRSVRNGGLQLVAPEDVVPLAENDFYASLMRAAGKFSVKARAADAVIGGAALRASRDAQARVAWVEGIARRAMGEQEH